MSNQAARPAVSPAETAWRATACIAGLFSLAVGLVMVAGHFASGTLDPLKSAELKEAKEALRASPADESVKQRIRNLDLKLRQEYFFQLSRRASGTYLMLAGLAVFVVAVTQASRFRKRLPAPKPRPEAEEQRREALTLARWSVAASGTVVGLFLLVLGVSFTGSLPLGIPEGDRLTDAPQSLAAAIDAASAAEMRQNWPRFRGPGGGGVAFVTNSPMNWDASTGSNIAWRIPSPARGFGSPVVWGDRVFLSGGDARVRSVFCFDTATGQSIWSQAVTNVPGSPVPVPEVPESTSYAAPTMATDGRRVYALFANGDLAALSLDGKPIWAKSFGALDDPYGHAASLDTWQDRVIVQLDQGESEAGKSRLFALDGRTGQVIWQKPRRVGASWATPIVIEASGKSQIITLALPWVIAYAAADGTELWRADCLNGEITPSPVFADGRLYVPSPSDKLMALRTDGQGDVTKTHVIWQTEENVPDVTSPVCAGGLVFALTTSGLLTCFDAADGKKLWEHDFEMEFHSSPSLAVNRLYLFSQDGSGIIVEASREFKELFRTKMPDAFHASPAFAGERMILRGVTNVWCVATPPRKS